MKQGKFNLVRYIALFWFFLCHFFFSWLAKHLLSELSKLSRDSTYLVPPELFDDKPRFKSKKLVLLLVSWPAYISTFFTYFRLMNYYLWKKLLLHPLWGECSVTQNSTIRKLDKKNTHKFLTWHCDKKKQLFLSTLRQHF